MQWKVSKIFVEESSEYFRFEKKRVEIANKVWQLKFIWVMFFFKISRCQDIMKNITICKEHINF